METTTRDAAGGPHDGPRPRVPGLRLLELLGTGGQGEVWLAEELASGDRVAVKVRHGAASRLPTAGCDHLARETALLRRIDHPHVVRLRRVLDLPGGARALVLDHAAGGSLAALVRRSGPLDASQACGVIVPIACALADLHDRGLVHGDLTPSNLLFTAQGRPLIADLGSARVLGEPPARRWGSAGYLDPACGAVPVPADDVFALGAVLRFCLTGDPSSGAGPATGSAPGSGAGEVRQRDAARAALLDLAGRCTDHEPDRRPDLRSVARIALAATAPSAAPVPDAVTAGSADRRPGGERVPGPVRPVRPVRPVSAGRARSTRAGASRGHREVGVGRGVAVVGVVAVAGVWWLAGHRDAPAPRPVGFASVAGRESPQAALARLAAGRAEAFRQVSAGPLTQVDEPGSPAWAADTSLVARLRATGLRLDGLSFAISDVRATAGPYGGLTVEARVVTSAYRKVTIGGTTVVGAAAPSRPTQIVLALVLGADGRRWLVRQTWSGESSG